jgi:hypothetical protein
MLSFFSFSFTLFCQYDLFSLKLLKAPSITNLQMQWQSIHVNHVNPASTLENITKTVTFVIEWYSIKCEGKPSGTSSEPMMESVRQFLLDYSSHS